MILTTTKTLTANYQAIHTLLLLQFLEITTCLLLLSVFTFKLLLQRGCHKISYMVPRITGVVNRLQTIGHQIGHREAQLDLLNTVNNDKVLLESRIMSSLRPRIGKRFCYRDLEKKKVAILADARRNLIKDCATVEATRDVDKFKLRFNKLIHDRKIDESVRNSLDLHQSKVKCELEKKHQKKVNFHRAQVLDRKNVTTKAPQINQKRKRHRQKTQAQRRDQNKAYKKRLKHRKQDWLNTYVDDIKRNKVKNLSDIDIPNTAYLYLDKGLGFVESKTGNKEDIQFDAKEFLRKLSWKVFFKNIKEDQEQNLTEQKVDDKHPSLRIPSRKHPPPDTMPILFNEIKSKVLGFLSTLETSKPLSNLTPAEQRGKAWLTKEVKAQNLFVTKADKGGAILILNFDDAFKAVKEEMKNERKFECLPVTAEVHMDKVNKDLVSIVKECEEINLINDNDRLIITGVTNNGGKKHSPVFRPVIPYPYPLFKIHKCSEEQINDKVIPPLRLVHATCQGPLYRLEKWCSPCLTGLSKSYCKDEYLQDTPDLIDNLESINSNPSSEEDLLFTLDVVALYPSISKDMALKAMDHAMNLDIIEDNDTKMAVRKFSEFILNKSFVVFENKVYRGKEGIPTGNCISRQVADISMHWLLFIALQIHGWNWWKFITFWKRFIDDIFGRWKGTSRQFNLFVNELNNKAKEYGIQFSDIQIGKSVHFLDITIYLDDNGSIQYCLYKKKTDARQFLNTQSFHPQDVFRSVPFSQMLRVISRNSTDENTVTDLAELKDDLIKCGHLEEKLDEIEPLAVHRTMTNYANRISPTDSSETDNKETLVFTTKFFKEVQKLKSFVRKLEPDIKQMVGEMRVIFALKKNESIEQRVVRNRKLSGGKTDPSPQLTEKISQACGSRGCATCPLLFALNEEIFVNGNKVLLDPNLSCKSKNLIYFAQCTFCQPRKEELAQSLNCSKRDVLFEDSYVGQTVSEGHTRINGHRKSFKRQSNGEVLDYKKSALSWHCQEEHPQNFDLKNFKIGFIRICNSIDLDREENRFITKFRTDVIGLNRIKVVR